MKKTGKELAPVENTAVSDELTNSISKMRSEGVQTLFDVIKGEASEFKLDMQKRAMLGEALGMEASDVMKWNTASDILRHFDSAELVRKYPEQAKNTLLNVLSVFPPTAIVSALMRNVPAETLSRIMGISLTASPDHLLHMLADHQTNVAARRSAEYMTDEPEEEGKRDLVIVCKDDLLFAQLKKLVETEDDEGEEVVIGTKDGTVRLLRWDEKKWSFRNAGSTLNVKSLLIGDVKGAETVLPLMDVKFHRHGVKYGWINGCACINADRAALRAKGAYAAFVEELGELPLPETVMKDKKIKLDLKTGLKIALATPLIAKDLYDDSKAVLRQMYFYGVMRFYYDHLEEFLQS